MLEGGADVLIVETIFDTLNAKVSPNTAVTWLTFSFLQAALFALDLIFSSGDFPKAPILISGTQN